MNTGKSTDKSPLAFFVLVFALTTPFWALSTTLKVEGLPDNLPVTDIGATFVPLIAASILVYRKERFAGVKKLLRRTFDYERIKQKIWYVPIIFLMPFRSFNPEFFEVLTTGFRGLTTLNRKDRGIPVTTAVRALRAAGR